MTAGFRLTLIGWIAALGSVTALGQSASLGSTPYPVDWDLPSITQDSWLRTAGDLRRQSDLLDDGPFSLSSFRSRLVPPATDRPLLTPATSSHPHACGICDLSKPCRCWQEAHKDHDNSGFIDLNTYWDTRRFAVTTMNLLANLPAGFQYFQFLNLDSPIGSDSTDWTGYFTEINLRRPITTGQTMLSAADWTIQYADGNLPVGKLRLGVRWRLHDTPSKLGRWLTETMKLQYSLNFHVIQTPTSGWQIEHVYRRSFLDNKLYVCGFCDHNIDNHGRSSNWVTEHQVGIRMLESLYAVAEYRYNSFLPGNSRQGLGIGLEYFIKFR